MYLLIFEFLGTNELLVILVVALILLGPRRLPEMSKKIGKSLSEFKRASEDFKRTWEKEVEIESAGDDARIERAIMPPAENSILDTTVERGSVAQGAAIQSDLNEDATAAVEALPAPSVKPIDPSVMQPAVPASSEVPVMTPPTRKRDWL